MGLIHRGGSPSSKPCAKVAKLRDAAGSRHMGHMTKEAPLNSISCHVSKRVADGIQSKPWIGDCVLANPGLRAS